MSEMWDFVPKSLERPKPYGMGTGREGVLMEVFVLTESGDLVGVFSSREKLTEHIVLCPTTIEFSTSPDGFLTEERECDYRTQRVLLDLVLTDA